MVPPRDDEHDRSEDGASGPAETDGGSDPGFDEAALYVVVREAVEDAILGVIGTLVLVGIGFVMVWAGIVGATSTGTLVGGVVGGVVAVVGVYVAASTLEVVPPVREWI